MTINSNDKISMFLLFPVPPDTIVNQQVHGMLDYTVKQLKVKLLNETVIYVSLQTILLKTCKRRLCEDFYFNGWMAIQPAIIMVHSKRWH